MKKVARSHFDKIELSNKSPGQQSQKKKAVTNKDDHENGDSSDRGSSTMTNIMNLFNKETTTADINANHSYTNSPNDGSDSKKLLRTPKKSSKVLSSESIDQKSIQV